MKTKPLVCQCLVVLTKYITELKSSRLRCLTPSCPRAGWQWWGRAIFRKWTRRFTPPNAAAVSTGKAVVRQTVL